MSNNLPWTPVAENQEDPEAPINDALSLLDSAVSGTFIADVSSGNVTLDAVQSVSRIIKITGATVADREVELPEVVRILTIQSDSANTQDVSLVRGASSETIRPGSLLTISTDGSEDGLELLSDAGGIPAGGSTGQVLAKVSNDDYDFAWIDPPSGGTPGSYRYYRVTGLNIPSSASMCISEIYALDDVGGNIAVSAVSVSSNYGGASYDASKARDGDVDSFWHSNTTGDGSYITLDFGSSTAVSQIKIYCKGQAYTQRAQNVTISVSDDNASYTAIRTNVALSYSADGTGYSALVDSTEP